MILSNVEGLGKWSKSLIRVKCDECSIEKELKYKLYTSYGYSSGDWSCRKCKTKKNNLEKWGVENPFQLEEVKEKIKITNLEKWGVENPSQNREINKKIKESISKLDKEEINNKRSKTVSIKYGVDNVAKLKEVKNKKTENSYKNWGVDLPIKNVDIKERIKKTNLEKWGKEICTKCNPIDKHQSGKEIKLYNLIKSLYNGKIIQNFKINKQEIDIYLPDLSLGFELNGIYWHSDKFKSKNFHKEKSEFFLEKGIRIIHIWEDDFDSKFNIIKSKIINLIGKSNKIWARKCHVRKVTDINLIREFLDNNHIQGRVNSNLKLGLYLGDELVSLMTFDHFEGRKRIPENQWNLNRFCNKLGHSVVGGASKLLKYFINNYNVQRIISYADRDWSSGDLYQKLGFNKVSESKPDYKYLVNDKRVHKSNFKKSITGLSESNLDIYKVWDCGKIKFEFITSKETTLI
jgi:hypothetical protein